MYGGVTHELPLCRPQKAQRVRALLMRTCVKNTTGIVDFVSRTNGNLEISSHGPIQRSKGTTDAHDVLQSRFDMGKKLKSHFYLVVVVFVRP